MFFEGERISRRARDDPRRRRRAAAPRSPSCCRCSARFRRHLFEIMAACRSPSACSIRRCTSSCRIPTRKSPMSRRRWAPIPREAQAPRAGIAHEFNPMLGFRGCRLAVAYPEIAEMQARAIFEAALEAGRKTGAPV
jgi:phosphoenolpyruvate synthase/pyruvate phosphate dikinase